MRSIRMGWALALASVSLIACSSGGGGAASSGADDGGADVVAPLDDASSGATVTKMVGAGGGTVAAAGLTLTIPSGALAADTAITIAPSTDPVPAGYTGLSPIYVFGPDGTTFQQPVTVDFMLTASGVAPTVYWSNAQGGYDALATTVTASVASASVTHFSKGFCGEGHGHDAAADVSSTPDTGSDATVAADTGAAMDSSTSPDSGVVDSGTASDTGTAEGGSVADAAAGGDAAPEAGPGSDSGLPADGATTDAGSADALADGSQADAATDAGINGINATIDGVPTTFASSPSVTNNGNGILTIVADDNPSSTHWEVSLVVNGLSTGASQCSWSIQPGFPAVKYTHFTSGVADLNYTTLQQGASCVLTSTANPTSPGQHATGTFSGLMVRVQDAGVGDAGANHTFSGSYDVIM